MPFDTSSWTRLGINTEVLLAKYTIADSEYRNMLYTKWSQDSYKIAAANVYTGVTQSEAVPQAYIDKNLETLERQIVLGGMRLAYLITKVFGNSAEETNIIEEEPNNFL